MRKPHKPQQFRPRHANEFLVLSQGTSYFPAMLAAIDEAQDRVALEMYWVASGALAERFIQALIRAADRGVAVFVLLDDYGSSDFEHVDRRRLTDAGVQLAFFNPLRLRIGWGNFVRDHRKLLLVDDATAFVGGAGICEPFDGADGWRENMVQIRGDCVSDWWQLFQRVWYRCSGVDCPPPPPARPLGRMLGQVLYGTPAWRPVLAAALRDIKRARSRVWLATPYFLPPMKLRRALARARRRNCDVRLLLPDAASCDLPGVQIAGRRYYDWLLRRGIRVFEYSRRVTHQKVLLADDRATIGSCNYDRWGLRWNLEASQAIESPALAGQVAQMLEQDLGGSREISLQAHADRPLSQRLSEWFWGLLDRAMVHLDHVRLIHEEYSSRRRQ